MLLVLFFILNITFFSCDGRDRKHKTNAEVLKEHRLFEAFSEEIKYIPEQRTEVYTDTILSTGFHVKLHYYSIADSYSSKTPKSLNHPNKTTYFKNFEAKVQVLKSETDILQEHIDKTLFRAFGPASFWDASIMQYIWIDYERCNKDFVVLNTSFQIPKTQVYKDFSIIIDKFGALKIKPVNLTETLL